MTPWLTLRLARVLGHLLKGLWICTLVFPWLGRMQRLARVANWSRELLDIFHVSVELASDGDVIEGGLLVANHVSWIDIFVINALFPSRFVAKSEVRAWPLVGYLCARAGTMFIERANGRDLRRTIARLATELNKGERIVVFPEGTSAAQGALLPFRANLFEAAVTARAVVQPLAIRYIDPAGRPHSAVEYIGMTSLLESMVAILSAEPIQAIVRIAPALPLRISDRREMARYAHHAVEAALSTDDHFTVEGTRTTVTAGRKDAEAIQPDPTENKHIV